MGRIVKRAKLLPCAALEWDRKAPNGADYIECQCKQGQRCRIEGLLLAVEVPLCKPHQEYFSYKWHAKVTPLWDSEAVEPIRTLDEFRKLPCSEGNLITLGGWG